MASIRLKAMSVKLSKGTQHTPLLELSSSGIKEPVFEGYWRSPHVVIWANRVVNKMAPRDTDITHSPQDTEHSKYLGFLRLLTSWLEGLSFAEISTVVGIKHEELRAVLHGEALLSPDAYDRIERLLEITKQLRSLMQYRVIGWWYKTGDPELNGRSPLDLLKDNRITDLERVVNSYFDTSYT